MENGVINQQEYNDAINQINADNDVKNDEIKLAREEAEKEKGEKEKRDPQLQPYA